MGTTGGGHKPSSAPTHTVPEPGAASNNNNRSAIAAAGPSEVSKNNLPLRLTIDPGAAPASIFKGSRRRRDSVQSGEDSPLGPAAARRGGELQMSPGFREVANMDWDSHSTGPLVPGSVSNGGGGGGGLSPRFLGLLSPGRRSGGDGNAAVMAAATAASLEAVKGMKLLQNFRAHTGAVWCAEFSRKGQYLATGGADGLVKVCVYVCFDEVKEVLLYFAECCCVGVTATDGPACWAVGRWGYYCCGGVQWARICFLY